MANRQPSSNLFIVFGVLLTLLFHAGLIGAYLYWQANRAEADTGPEETRMEFERVELLMYGEVMPDPQQLPFIANPAPETRPEEVVQIEPPPTPPEPQQEPPPPEEAVVEREPEPEREERPRDDTRHNPHRPENEEPLVGSREGHRGGTSLSARALENLWAPVVAAIQREVGRPGGITDSEASELQARIRIYFDETGRVLRYTWVDESGNQHFDDAVERAVNAFRLGSRRLPLPTSQPQEVERAIEQGVTLTVLPPQ